MKNNQKGQSIAEFAIVAGILSMLLIAIPMVSKLATVKLKSEQAADYVAWRVNKGINTGDSDTLSREVGQRFFARTGADVLSEQNADCDDAADQDMTGQSLVHWDSIQVSASQQNEKYSKTLRVDPLEIAARPFRSLKSNGQYSVEVTVPVNFVTGIVDLPEAFDIKSSSGTLRNNWAANNPNEIKQIVKKSRYLLPYELVQANINTVYNVAVASMGFEKKIREDGIYKMEVVPNDRKATLK
jgi:Tfp pilus assembly major pilin PilA